MGKFRVRSKNTKKGFRWAKGQSSSSNPQKTRFRDKARALAWHGLNQQPLSNPFASGPNRLTVESLLKHDVLMGNEVMIASEDAMSMTNKTFETFASDWTQCTNPCFERVLKKFNCTNAHDKEKLAILAAVTEVIKEKGGEETSTEYFAALLTTLEAAETQESLTSVLSLLSLVIKTVPREVLQSKFGMASKLLLDNLTKQAAIDPPPPTVRSIIGCLSVLLRAQSSFIWNQSSTQHIFMSLFAFYTHSKPKIRKASQHAMCSILKGSHIITEEDAHKFHPMVSKVASESCKKLNAREEPSTVLYTLTLLKEIIALFPQNYVKSICDSSLSLLKSKLHPHLNTCVMQMLFGLFNSQPAEATLGAELNARIITALYDFKPSLNDAQPAIAWLTVMQEGLINLSVQDPKLCLAHLPFFFSEAKKFWVSEKRQVVVAVTTALKAVCNESIKPHIETFCSTEDNHEKLQKILDHVLEGMGYQYHSSWDQVLNLMSEIFDVVGPICPDKVTSYLPVLSDRRNASNFAFTNELDYVVGRAVRTMGPRKVLSVLDLQITSEEKSYEFPRSWLLPVLRENIRNTELSFFIEYFLPLANKCRERSNKCLNVDDRIGYKTFQVLEYQIWALLPGFCNGCQDVKESFPSIAKTLGNQLQVRKDLRIDVLGSLRHLIAKNLDNPEHLQVLSGYAKNYLPILCNIYAKEEPTGSESVGQRLAVYETIKQYSKIAPKQRLEDMFDKAFVVYNNTQSAFEKEATIDILRAYFPYQDVDRIEKLYKLILMKLSSKDHKEQKKAYKVLEELCSSESENCQKYLRSVISDEKEGSLQKVLLKSLPKASPSSLAPRIRCLIHLIRQLDGKSEYHETFCKTVVPEAVMCVKAVNSKAREGAFNLLEVIAESLMRWNESQEDALGEYISLVSSGLAGDPAMIHCTFMALTRLFYTFHDLITDPVKEILVGNACHLLVCSAREAVGACLSFLRVFVQVNPVQKTGRQEILEKIVKAIANMTDDCQRHFRLKSRYLLDRIVKKFGYEMVVGLVPSDNVLMQKRLKNLRKAQLRKGRRDESKDKGNDDESDDDLEFRVRAKPKTMEEILAESDSDLEDQDDDDDELATKVKSKTKKKKSKAFIAEDEENIMDFLDPSAAQKISSVKPSKPGLNYEGDGKSKNKKNGGFKIAPDGRLIIKDSDDDKDEEDVEERKRNEIRKNLLENSDDEEEEKGNSFQNLVSSSAAARKRKMGGSVASSRRTSEPAMKYQAGGTGIHRPLQKSKGSDDQNGSFGAEYKSKKASGDVKRKGKPDPYAYVPLNRNVLNKRKKAKFEGQFKSVVSAAKKGANSGSKAKGKSKQTALSTRMKAIKI